MLMLTCAASCWTGGPTSTHVTTTAGRDSSDSRAQTLDVVIDDGDNHAVCACVYVCVSPRTAVMLASESSSGSAVEVLVQRGADLSAVDSLGHDVMHYAKLSGSSHVKSLLTAALHTHSEPGEKHTLQACSHQGR